MGVDLEISVAFVLSRPTKKIIGGYKIVYDYANYLSNKGMHVCIYYDCRRIGNTHGIKSSYIKKLWGRHLINSSGWWML